MATLRSTASLKRVQASDVKQWLREAWPGQARYPDDRRCHQLATRVNTIVDRHNAAAKRGASEEAIKKRRQDFLAAGRRARALKQALQCTMENLGNEQSLSTVEGLEPLDGDLAHHISVTTQALTAVDSFLALPAPPKFQDHAAPILWIAAAAREAWSDLLSDAPKGKTKVTFSPRPEGPLVRFVSLAQDAIGLAGEDEPGNKFATISDRLRRRQNRPRPKRAANGGVGGK